MVNKCCVPNCTGNYKGKEKVHVFSFPAEKEMERRKKWIAAIRRDNFTPSRNTVVCHLHFKNDDIIWDTKAVDWKTGNVLTAQLKKPRLRADAVPCKVPGCSTQPCGSSEILRDSPNEKREEREARSLRQALEESVKTHKVYDEKYSVSSYDELLCKIKYIGARENWNTLVKKEGVICIYIDVERMPHTIVYFLVCKELQVSIYVQGYQHESNEWPSKISSLHDFEKLMDLIESNLFNFTNSIKNSDLVLSILNNIDCKEEQKQSIDFLKDQLELNMVVKEQRRYKPSFLVLCSLLYFISAHAYRFLRSYANIIMPHPNTIKKLCANVECDPCNSNFLSYIQQKIPSLQDFERYVMLLVDEVHIKSMMDYKGGTIVGITEDCTLATTAHVFMVQSVLSSFKDVVYILPSCKMKSEGLFNAMKSVVIGLEKIGLKVICIITDNNAINGKAVEKFANPPQLSIVYPHPSDATRPLFYLVDSVHIFKCIRNNWTNLKNASSTFIFPGFNNLESKCYASFSALRTLFNTENDKLLRYGYKLSAKALWPSNLEKQNVQLVTQIFNDHVKNTLLELGPVNRIENYDGTAQFISVISNWWSILNVKTPLKGLRLRDDMQKPITDLNDDQCTFLRKFLVWLDRWEAMGLPVGTLTRETHRALKLTTYGMLELTSYCLMELKLSYLLPGKFQTDGLEARFGKYRQLLGSVYNISLRQVFEAEKKLRLCSIMQLSLRGSSDKISITSLGEDVENIVTHNTSSASRFWHITISETDMQGLVGDLPILTYITGYCCHAVLRSLKCDICSEFLLIDKSLASGIDYKLINEFDRGGLKYPQKIALHCVMKVFAVLQKLLEKGNVENFLKEVNQRRTAFDVVKSIVLDNDDALNYEFCSKHESVKVWEKIAWRCINIVLNNFCKKVNNDVALEKSMKGRKRKLNTFL